MVSGLRESSQHGGKGMTATVVGAIVEHEAAFVLNFRDSPGSKETGTGNQTRL